MLFYVNFVRNLFIDCAVQAGSNPTVMLIKELIETEQITGEQATWAWLLSATMSKHQLRNSLKSLWYVLLNGVVKM